MNPLSWILSRVKAQTFDPYLAALVIIATPVLLVWICVEVWSLVFR
jgi:hypothetical protein